MKTLVYAFVSVPIPIQIRVKIMTVAVSAPAKNISILFFAIAGFGVIKCTEGATHEFAVRFTVVAELLFVAADMSLICDVVILCLNNFLTHFCAPSYVV
jgi:hypothetical protein